jgi:DNA-directed RNA polymerase specialized sigma24 family protein
VRPHRRRLRWLQAVGWYELAEDTVLTSTRQAEALNPAIVATHPPLAGPLLGVDVDTSQSVTCDPHELYRQRRVTSPNVVILGDINTAKSSLAKTQYVLRVLALGRQVVVFDRKLQAGRGEYHRAAELAGGSVVRFARRGGTVINVLDPRISATSDDADDGGQVGQDRLLILIAEHAHGRLGSAEMYALRVAHRTALDRARAAGRVAVLRDVVDALYRPDPSSVPRRHLAEAGVVTVRRVTEWGLRLAMDLERFIDGDLSGLIDGPTSGDVDLAARLLVFDTSALDEASPALSLVMAVLSTYLASVWSGRPGQRLIVLEEGYHTLRLSAAGTTSVASILRSLAKRGRGIGLSFVTVLHHISDIPPDSDAMSLIREAGIVHVYAQSKEPDADAAVRLFRLPAWVTEELATLPPGVHVLKVGSEPARLVRHLRTGWEQWVTDTDAAMLGEPGDQPGDQLGEPAPAGEWSA